MQAFNVFWRQVGKVIENFGFGHLGGEVLRAGGWARKLLGELGFACASPNRQAQQRTLQLRVLLIVDILKG